MKSKHPDLPILATGDWELQLADVFFDSATNSFLPLLDHAPSNRYFLQDGPRTSGNQPISDMERQWAIDRRFFLWSLAVSASIFSLGLWKCSVDKSDYKPAMFARRI